MVEVEETVAEEEEAIVVEAVIIRVEVDVAEEEVARGEDNIISLSEQAQTAALDNGSNPHHQHHQFT